MAIGGRSARAGTLAVDTTAVGINADRNAMEYQREHRTVTSRDTLTLPLALGAATWRSYSQLNRRMEIHGLRIYPDSVSAVEGSNATIFIRGSVREKESDFFYIFRPLASMLRGHYAAVDLGSHGTFTMERLRRRYGAGLIDADLDWNAALLTGDYHVKNMGWLSGDEFPFWGRRLHADQACFLPIFRAVVPFDRARDVYQQLQARPGTTPYSERWPVEVRAIFDLWDDMYWQLFTTERSDIDLLVQAHAGDPKLSMHYVDFDREYPRPGYEKLRSATDD